ncbi:hypothetical protein J5N97_012756 [Dioscorea zingiberensis]|uniref:Non-specific serine/threonine protein kinase n=1 Tax=Dioscorea zingiberensis TaxID=325984 RepID=A0A9D5HIE9_9LILI|nr:hypothetical protein J5N97_012756 [Dioscorea zingiberensis]
MLFMNEAKCSESLAELYRLLNEEDMRCGLLKKRSMTAETRAGLSLAQHGYWQQAQSLFYQAMIKTTQGTYSNAVPKAEMYLWEEQWLYCASQLSQWDVLADYGKSVDNYEILLDCLWKVPDWAYMKDNVIPKAQVEETPKLRVVQAFFALHDRECQWCWGRLRILWLKLFQQLVEVQESARILMDIANGNKQTSGNSAAVQNVYVELKDILETWRLRTPNEWDNLSVWYDLFQWRNEMYNVVIDAFKDYASTSPQLHHLGYRDKAWNVNKLAHIARKQGLHDVCVTILDKMYGHSTMEVQALYYWLRTFLMERRDVAAKSELGRNIALAQQRMQQTISGPAAGTHNMVDGGARPSNHPGASEGQIHQGTQSSGVGGSHEVGNSQTHESERGTTVESSGNSGHEQPPQSSSAISENAQIGSRRNAALSWVASAASGFDAAKDIMEALRSKHPNLASELEAFLSEIGSRFVTLPEERLLAVVNALLHRCYTDAVNKHVDFVREYKQDFERDLDPESTATFPATLSDLTERLKHWKNVLQSNVEDRFPPVLKLEEESKVLRDFHAVDVEIPGQYFTDQEVAPDHTVKLDRVGADIPTVRRHGTTSRRLTLIGSDGSQRHFNVQTSLTPNARSDERVLQLFRVLNKMFDKHKESRRRHLTIHTPIIIPVWSQVRMVEDDLMYSTFLEVSPEAVVELRMQAYNDIIKTVNDNIFSQYMYKTLPTGNLLWTFKKQFAIQLALSCFMSYMLQIGGRSPNKILFAKNTGKIFQIDFHPGLLEICKHSFHILGVEGLIVSAMCAAAQSVVSPKQTHHIWHQLAMFFRDELLSWSWRRPLGMPSSTIAASGIGQLDFEQKVTTNVEHVIGRIKGISPQYFTEEEESTTDPPQSVQRGVTDLVEAALSPRNLCMMDPTWHPWF